MGHSVLNQNDSNNQPSTEHYLKSASKATDLAVAYMGEAKLKFVDVYKPPSWTYKTVRGRENEGLQMKVCDEWVRVTFTAVPGFAMEDVGRRREHRRVGSTIAMAEVTFSIA